MKPLTASFLQKACNCRKHCKCHQEPSADCNCNHTPEEKNRFARAWEIVRETGCTFKEALAQLSTGK